MKPSTKPRQIRGVVADLAGTLIDHGSCAPAGVFVSLFARHGITITFQQARGPMGLQKRDHIAELLKLQDVREAWREQYGAVPDEADVDALYAKFIPLQLQTLPEYGDVIPGVVAAVKSLRDGGIRIGVTTGYNREMMDVVLGDLKKGGFEPDAAVSTSDVAHGRPAPWLLFRAMELLNVYPPWRVIKIGDTIPDIEAGRNAGCWTVGVTRTGNMLGLRCHELKKRDPEQIAAKLADAAEAFTRAGAHDVLESFADLPDRLASIEARIAAGKRP